MEDNERKNATECLKDVLINYLIYKKEYEAVPIKLTIKGALYSSLSGLDDAYNTSEFIKILSKDFNEMSLLLEKISIERYKEEKEYHGIMPSQPNIANKELSVEEVAQRLTVSEEAIRKVIRAGRLVASKKGHSYIITEDALDTYIKTRKK